MLFEDGEAYHVVNDRGTFDGMDVGLRDNLNQQTLQWALEVGLVGGGLLSEKKFRAADPALCTLLLYDYADLQIDVKALQVLTKFFVLLLVADDLWENPNLHEQTKRVMFQCFDAL